MKVHPINFMLITAAFFLLLGFWVILERRQSHEFIGLVLLMGGFLLPVLAIGYRLTEVGVNKRQGE